jgi:hypothetical protein
MYFKHVELRVSLADHGVPVDFFNAAFVVSFERSPPNGFVSPPPPPGLARSAPKGKRSFYALLLLGN